MLLVVQGAYYVVLVVVQCAKSAVTLMVQSLQCYASGAMCSVCFVCSANGGAMCRVWSCAVDAM